jgi:hypothetical protein
MAKLTSGMAVGTQGSINLRNTGTPPLGPPRESESARAARLVRAREASFSFGRGAASAGGDAASANAAGANPTRPGRAPLAQLLGPAGRSRLKGPATSDSPSGADASAAQARSPFALDSPTYQAGSSPAFGTVPRLSGRGERTSLEVYEDEEFRSAFAATSISSLARTESGPVPRPRPEVTASNSPTRSASTSALAGTEAAARATSSSLAPRRLDLGRSRPEPRT